MVKSVNKLSPQQIKSMNKPGRYNDGKGLYLQISITGSKSWIYRFMIKGNAREMGLGSVTDISLARARAYADENRMLVKEGIDPIARRNKTREENIKTNSIPTFQECAEKYIRTHSPSWSSMLHINQWKNSLSRLVFPVIGKQPIDMVDINTVLKVLKPLWTSKTETATRLRGRIEKILDWATVNNFRTGENPARWKGQLEQLLPSPSKIKKVKHFDALPYKQINEIVAILSEKNTVGANAVLFAIYTACRSGEVRYAKWEEINWENKIWTIPEERMKRRIEQIVPLSSHAVKLLQTMKISDDQNDGFIFIGLRSGRPISDMTMTKCIRELGYEKPTVHGFRSSFRDWAAEAADYPRDVIEMSLAHGLKNKTEAAYYRSNQLEKRRELMEEWSHYCHREK